MEASPRVAPTGSRLMPEQGEAASQPAIQPTAAMATAIVVVSGGELLLARTAFVNLKFRHQHHINDLK